MPPCVGARPMAQYVMMPWSMNVRDATSGSDHMTRHLRWTVTHPDPEPSSCLLLLAPA